MSHRFLRQALFACLVLLPLSAHAALGDGLKKLTGGLGTTLGTLNGGLSNTLGTLGGGLGTTLDNLGDGLDLTGEHLRHQYLNPTAGTSSFEADIEYQGVARRVLYIRPDHQPDALAPAVVLLHYRWGTAEVIANLADAGRLAAEHGAWLIVPEASDGQWQDDPDSRSATDDVGFLAKLVTTLPLSQPIDPKRIYMAGMSNGGFMVERFACEHAELIAGAAIVAATLRKTQSAACAPARGMPIAILLGSNDPRLSIYMNLGLGLLSGDQTFARFSALNHCDPTLTISSQLPDVANDSTVTTLFEARGCSAGVVQYYAINGGGHTWPQGVYGNLNLLGHVAKDFNATDAIWSLFETLRLP